MADAHRSFNGTLVVFAGAFLALLAGTAAAGTPLIIPSLYISVSLLAFLVYAQDKHAAQTNRRRISERTLHVFGLLGGWPGALLAQELFRHKTRKTRFQIVFWLTVFANGAALYWLLRVPEGQAALSSALDGLSRQTGLPLNAAIPDPVFPRPSKSPEG